MKKYSLPLMINLFLLAAVVEPQTAFAQNKKDNTKSAAITELVMSQRYTFKARSASPLSGRLRQLTSDYDLQVSKDTIISYLPYFGRAYSAPADLGTGGIQFTSTGFQYTLTEKKKEGWNVSIKYKDAGDVQQMQLRIFTNGSASLQVTSNNRQGISFDGYITSPPAPLH